ncbi:MAG: two-component sensor histidine kinase [Hyphomicrobiales bacterium]|nr:MAG: two-component sensor histidine kinase [Hyphomicrobiales bacterium]
MGIALKASFKNLIAKISGKTKPVARTGNGVNAVDEVVHVPANNVEDALNLLDLAADWVTLHAKNGLTTNLSGKTRTFFGVPEADLLEDGFIKHVHVQDRVAFLSSISDCFVDGCESTITIRLLLPKLELEEVNSFWCELQFRPFIISDQGRSLRQVLAIGRDVTSQMEAMQQLEQENDQAQSTSDAKTQMLANMSHELRTPLNAIIGFSDMLQLDKYENIRAEKQDEYVGIINSSANHLLSVVNGILDMSKIEAGKYEICPEPFDLAGTIQSTMSMLQVEADKGDVRFSVGSLDQLPEMTADHQAVVQILTNVLSNAIKFTNAGGAVWLDVERVGRNIKFKVNDSGIGISQQHIEKLGEPFYQADSKYDRKYEGTGLGLSVVFGLVELHGGSVHIQSQPDEGTTVSITLPVVVDMAPPVPADAVSEITRLKPQLKNGTETDFNIVRKIA